ncbi:MAG: amino acid ABC transporter substrate-binding protein [Desulfobacteraceae bacterium]|nr:amino acid ABC transporter substrate-binding protein [Desulfobacteraceae bacterium]
MKKLFFFIMVLVLVVVQSTEAKIVNVTTITDYAPFCFYKKGQQGFHDEVAPNQASSIFNGFAWQILLQSYHAMGYTVRLSIFPWKRGMVMMDKGQVDIIFPTVKNPERLKKYAFSKELSYPPNYYLIYVSKDRPFKWHGLKSLNKKKVGVIKAFSYGPAWAKYLAEGKAKIYEFYKLDDLFQQLAMERVDAIVGYQLSYDYNLHKLGMADKFKRMPPFDESKSFVMGKKNPKVENLLSIFDQGKAKLKESGKLKEIMIKWGFGHLSVF